MPVPGTRLSAKIVSLFVESQPCNQFASKQPFPVAYRLSHIAYRVAAVWLLRLLAENQTQCKPSKLPENDSSAIFPSVFHMQRS